MGLDMYLKVKHKPQNELEAIATAIEDKKTTLTGACGGLFSIAPDDNGCEEIGYWRKAYDQRDIILDNIASYGDREDGEDNCVDFYISPEEVDKILAEAKAMVSKIEKDYAMLPQEEKFFIDEDGKKYENSIEDYSELCSSTGTFCSYTKWKDTVEFFTKARKIYLNEPEAEIYFEQWY